MAISSNIKQGRGCRSQNKRVLDRAGANSPARFLCIIQWNDVLCDHANYRCGIRTTEFTNRNGFYLNGKPVTINGVGLHQDIYYKNTQTS